MLTDMSLDLLQKVTSHIEKTSVDRDALFPPLAAFQQAIFGMLCILSNEGYDTSPAELSDFTPGTTKNGLALSNYTIHWAQHMIPSVVCSPLPS